MNTILHVAADLLFYIIIIYYLITIPGNPLTSVPGKSKALLQVLTVGTQIIIIHTGL